MLTWTRRIAGFGAGTLVLIGLFVGIRARIDDRAELLAVLVVDALVGAAILGLIALLPNLVPSRLRSRRRSVSIIVAFGVGVALAAAHLVQNGRRDDSAARCPGIEFTIAKETTYITEPLRPDGYPDYIAALNLRAGDSVTPGNNAAVLIWQAMGPKEISKPLRAEFFECSACRRCRKQATTSCPGATTRTIFLPNSSRLHRTGKVSLSGGANLTTSMRNHLSPPGLSASGRRRLLGWRGTAFR
jgi:hypothetical protein